MPTFPNWTISHFRDEPVYFYKQLSFAQNKMGKLVSNERHEARERRLPKRPLFCFAVCRVHSLYQNGHLPQTLTKPKRQPTYSCLCSLWVAEEVSLHLLPLACKRKTCFRLYQVTSFYFVSPKTNKIGMPLADIQLSFVIVRHRFFLIRSVRKPLFVTT